MKTKIILIISFAFSFWACSTPETSFQKPILSNQPVTNTTSLAAKQAPFSIDDISAIIDFSWDLYPKSPGHSYIFMKAFFMRSQMPNFMHWQKKLAQNHKTFSKYLLMEIVFDNENSKYPPNYFYALIVKDKGKYYFYSDILGDRFVVDRKTKKHYKILANKNALSLKKTDEIVIENTIIKNILDGEKELSILKSENMLQSFLRISNDAATQIECVKLSAYNNKYEDSKHIFLAQYRGNSLVNYFEEKAEYKQVNIILDEFAELLIKHAIVNKTTIKALN